MAEGGGSIAEELFDAIRLRDYCEYVPKLNKADIMNPKEFAESMYSDIYELDTRICYHDRRINKDHIYDIFSDFSGTDASTAKVDMLSEVSENYDWYESRGRVILNIQGRTLASWLSYHLERKSARADELALYALSHLYNRHTVVLGKNRPWCTIRPTGDPKEADFPTSCDVHLLYIGVNMFAPLKPKTEKPPDFTQGYLRQSDINWARAPEMNYAAYFNEEEYSDYVEVISETPRSQSRHQHHCAHSNAAIAGTSTSQPIPPEYRLLAPHKRPASCTVTSAVSQPVFPEQEDYSITYEFDPVNTNISNDNGNIEHLVTINKGKGIPKEPLDSRRTKPAHEHSPSIDTNLKPLQEGTEGPNLEKSYKSVIVNISSGTSSNDEPGTQKHVSVETADEALDQKTDETPLTTPLPQSLSPSVAVASPSKTGPDSEGIINENDPDREDDSHYMIDHSRDCYISLKRLSQGTLDKYTRNQGGSPTMQTSSSSSTESAAESGNNSEPGMKLRERAVRSNMRPVRKASKNINYAMMDIGSEPEEPSPKPVANLRPRLGPSKSRMRAQ